VDEGLEIGDTVEIQWRRNGDAVEMYQGYWRLIETNRDTRGGVEIGGCLARRRGWVADGSVGKRGYQVTKR